MRKRWTVAVVGVSAWVGAPLLIGWPWGLAISLLIYPVGPMLRDEWWLRKKEW